MNITPDFIPFLLFSQDFVLRNSEPGGDEPESHGKAFATFPESGLYDSCMGAGGLSLGGNFSVVFMSEEEEPGIRRRANSSWSQI
jgi:hypothetical protein